MNVVVVFTRSNRMYWGYIGTGKEDNSELRFRLFKSGIGGYSVYLPEKPFYFQNRFIPGEAINTWSTVHVHVGLKADSILDYTYLIGECNSKYTNYLQHQHLPVTKTTINGVAHSLNIVL